MAKLETINAEDLQNRTYEPTHFLVDELIPESDYVTACCLGKRIMILNGLTEVLRQQKAIGNNLNQLTVLANMGNESTQKAVTMISESGRQEISALTQDTRNKIHLCAWISITAVILCAVLCALVVLWSR